MGALTPWRGRRERLDRRARVRARRVKDGGGRPLHHSPTRKHRGAPAKRRTDSARPRVTVGTRRAQQRPTRPPPGQPTTRRRLHAQFDALKPTTGAGDLLAAVREAADLEIPKDKAQRVIPVLTDRKRQGWRLDQKPIRESPQPPPQLTFPPPRPSGPLPLPPPTATTAAENRS